MARVLILGGGCRGRQLAVEVLTQGHAVRIVTRSETGRGAIEATGAECFTGDPLRLGTLRGALEGVAVVCWLFATATGPPEELWDLHTSRLPAFLGAAVDSTMRGFVYEVPAAGAGAAAAGADTIGAGIDAASALAEAMREGGRVVEDIAARNAISATALTTDPRDVGLWMRAARATLSLYL